MKAAVLIGISRYDTVSNLPACSSDVELMKKILGATGLYDELLEIRENTISAKVKTEITAWIESLQGKKIEDVFFYYTGHGDFYDGEFYFPLSDFDKSKRKQTSLSNNEVDIWLKSLNPSIAIKVVDACHAGISYVKDDNQTFEKYLKKSGASFQKCYFMFSSALEQSSYQDNELSYFTRSFAQAIKTHQAKQIRYKDIIDFISDDFVSNASQTPFFVTQAHNTEVFCHITPELQKIWSDVSQLTIVKEEQLLPEPSGGTLTLKDIVEQNAKDYCTETEVLEILEAMKAKVEGYNFSEEFCSLHDVEYSFEQFSRSTPKISLIGQWLDKHDHNFFAEPIYIEEEKAAEPPRTEWEQLILGATPRLFRKIKRVDGYKLTADLPYKSIEMVTQPKYPNIHWGNGTIRFLISKTAIRFFHFFTHYKEKNWSDRELLTGFEWQTKEFKLRDLEGILDYLNSLQNDFETFLIDHIRHQLES